MVQRLTYRRRHPYNSPSNKIKPYGLELWSVLHINTFLVLQCEDSGR